MITVVEYMFLIKNSCRAVWVVGGTLIISIPVIHLKQIDYWVSGQESIPSLGLEEGEGGINVVWKSSSPDAHIGHMTAHTVEYPPCMDEFFKQIYL